MEIINLKKNNVTALEIARIGVKSLIYEVSIAPKAGLISRCSNGSHKDMNFYTFIDSAFSLEDYFIKCWKYGKKKNIDKYFFLGLRELGIDAEKKMYKATENINTHKGTIFSLGIIISVISNVFFNEKEIKILKVVENIKKISKGLLKEFEEDNRNTKGIEAYKKYGLEGARGLAISGYEIVFLDGVDKLKTYLKKYSLETSLIILLFYYISKLDDTNIVGRTNLEELKYIKEKSLKEYKKIFENNFSDKLIRESMEKFNEYFVNKNISPGGSADLIILTLFIYFLEKI